MFEAVVTHRAECWVRREEQLVAVNVGELVIHSGNHIITFKIWTIDARP